MKKGLTFVFMTLILVAPFISAQTVTIEDFKAVLITAIQSYFSNTPVVTVEELKDLLYAYFGAADVVDLSETGTFSGEKLETIYNKVKGVPKWPDPNAPLGSKNNPIKLDYEFIPTAGLHYYGYKWCQHGGFGWPCYYLHSGQKVYFLIDPIAFTGKSCRGFVTEICWGNSNENLKFYLIIRDKKTGQETDEQEKYPFGNFGYNAKSTFYNNILPYYLNNSAIPKESKVDDLQFIYAAENLMGEIPRDEECKIWWAGCFPSCEELGGVCKENCYKYNDCNNINVIEPCDELYYRCCKGSCTNK